MRSLLLFLLLFPAIVFGSVTLQYKLENDSLIVKYFPDQDILELVKIISFVDSCVLSENKYSEIDRAYHYFLDSLFVVDDNIVAIDEEKRNDFLFSIDKIVFDEIWIKDTIARKIRTRDTVYVNLENFISFDLRNNGEYMGLLKELGNSNEYFKQVYEHAQNIGGLSPASTVGLIYYNHQFDFNEINMRLWAAILILTMEESLEKKLDRYFSE